VQCCASQEQVKLYGLRAPGARAAVATNVAGALRLDRWPVSQFDEAMEELRRALAEAKAARLQGERTMRTRSASASPPQAQAPARRRSPSRSPSRSPPASELLAAQRTRLADADASALVSRAEQAIEARRRRSARERSPSSSPERPLSPIAAASPAGSASARRRRSSARRGSPRGGPDSSWTQLNTMNDALEWRLREDRSPSPPPAAAGSPTASLSPDSLDGSPRRRSFEPVSADERILQRLEQPELAAPAEEEWHWRGEYTFHPLTAGHQGKQSVLTRAKRYLREHAGLGASARISDDVVEVLLAKEVADGYITPAQARPNPDSPPRFCPAAAASRVLHKRSKRDELDFVSMSRRGRWGVWRAMRRSWRHSTLSRPPPSPAATSQPPRSPSTSRPRSRRRRQRVGRGCTRQRRVCCWRYGPTVLACV